MCIRHSASILTTRARVSSLANMLTIPLITAKWKSYLAVFCFSFVGPNLLWSVAQHIAQRPHRSEVNDLIGGYWDHGRAKPGSVHPGYRDRCHHSGNQVSGRTVVSWSLALSLLAHCEFFISFCFNLIRLACSSYRLILGVFCYPNEHLIQFYEIDSVLAHWDMHL